MTDETNLGDDLIASMREAVAIVKGEAEPGRVHLSAGAMDVRAIRAKTGLSREAFSSRFGLKLAAVRDWEQGLRKPDPAAQTLLRVIQHNPEAVAEAVAAA